MTLSRRRLLIAAVVAAGLQTGVLATMITSNARIVSDGVPVRLKTVPVDPRDLLRGDYVVLNYEFSALDSALIADPWPVGGGGQRLSVRLEPGDDGFWHPVEGSFYELEPVEGSVILKSLPFDFEPAADKPATVRADYGLERHYVAEGDGKALEEARNKGQVVVTAHVAPDGAARIVSLDVLEAAP